MNFKSNKMIMVTLLCMYFFVPNLSIAEVEIQEEIVANTYSSKFPDYTQVYIGNDKYETFNRKMFHMNMNFNKYALKPIHVIWASIMPKYGMDRIQSAYNNIQYPKRLVSSLLQKDFTTSKTETIRFLTNSTLGLGGMYDPARKILHLEQKNEGMEEALTKCNIKSGPYLVMPLLASTSPRGIVGTLFDNALNPSNYIASPIAALAKIGFSINNTYSMQPMLSMVQSTYADPYDIARKMYGIERYIKVLDLDRKSILETSAEIAFNGENNDPMNMNRGMDSTYPNIPKEQINISPNDYTQPSNKLDYPSNTDINPYPIKPGNHDDIKDPPYSENRKGNGMSNNIKENNDGKNLHVIHKFSPNLKADINLDNYFPQNPVTDAMRTALFEQPDINKSIWSEFSIWNRCFAKRIKTSSIIVDSTKDEYKYKYIMQKDKNAPVVIFYPSIGEGINSHHSVVMAKLFYDEGYSVIIQGSHFHWEFVKSMPDSYKPGLPARDADYLRLVTHKIIHSLERKYDCKFENKTVVGTSFGAMTTLFLAQKESIDNTLDIDKYISINPPIELVYAMREIDKHMVAWKNNPNNLKDKVAVTASKVMQLYQQKNNNVEISILPFTEDEAKIITGFVLHQKLSDLIFTLENTPKNKKTDIYQMVNNMNYEDYAKKYLVETHSDIDSLMKQTSLFLISDYLKNNDNYTIYHTMDDYLVNGNQLSSLKIIARDNLVLINNGSHLGFLYRDEFINELKNALKNTKERLAISK